MSSARRYTIVAGSSGELTASVSYITWAESFRGAEESYDMIIASVSTVKDECDIIELFVRINSRLIDRFYIVDNGSSDATGKIINMMIDEGFPITLYYDESIDYPQETLITRLLSEIHAEKSADWVVAIDADEFLLGERDELIDELQKVPPKSYAKLRWVTYVPVQGGYFDATNPLWSMFRRREFEPRQFCKVVIPVSLITQGKIGPGNHVFKKSGIGKLPFKELTCRLAHVPVRSSDQIVSKAILGSSRLALKRDRKPGEGYHWDVIAEEARLSHYKFNDQALKLLALRYASIEGNEIPNACVSDERIGRETDVIRYTEYSVVDVVNRLDSFVQSLLTRIKSVERNGKTGWFRKPFSKKKRA